MKKFMLVLLVIPLLFLVSCGTNATTLGTAEVQDISVSQAKALLDSDDSIILVDVRTLDEYNESHIADSILLPLDTVSTNAKNVIPDKNATYIIYCRTGNRSAQASESLVEQGYQYIYNMLGGISQWPYGTVS